MGGGGGQNQTWVLGTLVYKGVQVETGGENWLELVFNIHTPLFPTVNSVAKT